MILVVTVIACLFLWFIETWILAFLGLLLMPLFTLPFTLFIRWKPLQMDDDFASEHPGRYHVATFLSRVAKFLAACTILAVTIGLLMLLQRTSLPIYWPALYALAVIISLQFFPTRGNSGTWFSSYAHRLSGGYSEVRSSYAAREAGLPPEEILEPIRAKRRAL